MRALFWFGLALAVGGCKKTADRPIPTGPFAADLILDVNLRSHSAEARLVTPDKTCVEIGDKAKATLGGQPLKVKSKGGSKTGTYGHGSKPEVITDCEDPVFELADTKSLEALTATTLEIADGARIVRATFLNLFAPRSLRLDREEGATLKAGDKLHVIWAPPTDKISAVVLDRGKPITPPELRVKVEPTPTPGTYDLTVPPAWTGEGEAKVKMNMTIVPGLERCDGAKSCNGVITTTLEGYRVKVTP
jgi:hypothetical protein